MLLLLLLVPLLILAYIWSQRRRTQYALRYASLSLVKEALGRGPGWRRHVPPALFLAGLSVMIFALARPQAVVTLPSQEGTIILTMDVSGSMIATDLQPNRMEAAKAAARTFIERQPESVRIGVVSFSDNAFVVQPPTTDHDAALNAINRLAPQRGTAIGRGIVASLDAIFETSTGDIPNANVTPQPTPTPMPKGQYAPAIVVLLTDGENNQGPRPEEVAQEAAARGVRVYTIGVGSKEGAIVRIRGESIRTRLDENTLKQVADITDANYYNASNEKDLQAIYKNLGTQLVLRTDKIEITALFTGLAVLFSLAGGILSLLWFNRLP